MPAGQTANVLPTTVPARSGASPTRPVRLVSASQLAKAAFVVGALTMLLVAPLAARAGDLTRVEPVQLQSAPIVTMNGPAVDDASPSPDAAAAAEEPAADTGADTGFDSAAVDPAIAEPGDVLQRGVASWYGHAWKGRRTANGARFNPEAMTAASHTLPLGTRVWVTLEGTARSVLVTITDRQGSARRVIDLSLAAARKIGLLGRGTARVVLRRA